MSKAFNLTGQVFGRLTAIEISRKTLSGNYWLCTCCCGKRCEVKANKLGSGNTQSCGCLRSELVSRKNFRHGLLIRRKQSPEFYAFINAKRRCQNPDDARYKDYGGRGIEFRFWTFEQFIKAVGPRPSPKHSLDRKNNDGHYEIDNVRWATASQQQRNKRTSGRI